MRDTRGYAAFPWVRINSYLHHELHGHIGLGKGDILLFTTVPHEADSDDPARSLGAVNSSLHLPTMLGLKLDTRARGQDKR